MDNEVTPPIKETSRGGKTMIEEPLAVEVVNAIKIYETSNKSKKVAALSGCDLAIKQGELISIIGPSGAGKTTLLNVISGNIGLSSGDVRIGGIPVDTLSNTQRIEFRRKYIGSFTQHGRANLDPRMKVKDAIFWELTQAGWNNRDARERVTEVIKSLKVEHLEDQMCGKLSAGEAMRVSLLKAVAKKPFIVLADEPTGQLDTENIKILIDLMRDVVQGGTSIIVATHDIRFQTLSDRTLMILDGRLASEEEAFELLKERTAFLSNKYSEKKIYDSKLIIDSSSSVRVPDNILKRLGINKKVIIAHNLSEDFATLRKSDDDEKASSTGEESKFSAFSGKAIGKHDLIEASFVSKTYTTDGIDNHVLENVSFKVKPGEFIVFLGPSGSGKTTLMNILAGLEKPSKGEIKIDGVDMHSGRERDKRRILLNQLSYVTQNYTVHPYLSVEENATLPLLLKGEGKSGSEDKVTELFESLEMEDYMDVFPTELSGGQQQRSSLIASLVKDTEIFIADEPTANLDSDLAVTTMNLLTNLAEQGKTIILATHDYMLIRPGYRVIRIGDRIILEDVIADQNYVDQLFEKYLI